MAANYLEVQKDLEEMRNYKKELEEQLERSDIEMKKVAEETDNEEAKKFLQLQKEKVLFFVSIFVKVKFDPMPIFF